MNINQLTGNRNRIPLPELNRDQYDSLVTLLEGEPYSKHLNWNGREYFVDGTDKYNKLWVVAWVGHNFESGDRLIRPNL